MPTRLEGLVLEIVLMRVTDVDLRVSIGGVRRTRRAAAAAERRKRRLSVEPPLPGPSTPPMPLWYIKWAYQGADSWTQYCLIKTATAGGRLAPAARWRRGVGGSSERPDTLEPAAVGALADEAAECGNLDVLASLLVRSPPGFFWGPQLCRAAARGGALETLRWLRSDWQDPPCPWDAGACTEAAKAEQLAVLQWLRDQEPPCPWDAGAVVAASQASVLHMLM